mmetsp:Transcript_9414/g.9745  ORF Transcript_9414/g.9745 Transcript_9414/m.9745 type:complete len:320 (+) Transcript_9414:3-962(+)
MADVLKILLMMKKDSTSKGCYEKDLIKNMIQYVKNKGKVETSFLLPARAFSEYINEKAHNETNFSIISGSVNQNSFYTDIPISEIGERRVEEYSQYSEDIDYREQADKSKSMIIIKEKGTRTNSNTNSFEEKEKRDIQPIIENIYENILSRSQISLDNKNCKIYLIVIIKQLLLDFGLSLKKFYDETVRKITMNLSFSSFVDCFENIIFLESSFYSYYKYKVIFCLFAYLKSEDFRIRKVFLSESEVNYCLDLIQRSERVRDGNWSKVKQNLLPKYRSYFSSSNKKELYFSRNENNKGKDSFQLNQLLIVLEHFFELKD